MNECSFIIIHREDKGVNTGENFFEENSVRKNNPP
jgi:hypothetical protein